MITIVATAIFVGVNILGVKEATNLQITLVLLMISVMILYGTVGLLKIDLQNFLVPPKFSLLLLIQGAAFVFVSYGGLLKSAALSEEVKNSVRDVPRGLISAILFKTVLSTLYVVVIIATLPKHKLESTFTPAAVSAKVVFGQVGYILITLASLMAFFLTTANAGIMSASRYLLALSRDHLLPPVFALLSEKRRTPHFSLMFTGLTILLIIKAFPLEYLVKFASATILMAYVLGSLAVIIFRESKIKAYNPSFRVPFYLYLPIFNIAIFTLLFLESGLRTVELTLVMLLISVAVYKFYGSSKVRQDFALLYLMKRILSERDTEGLLEAELEEIVLHREEVPKTELREIFEKALVFDLHNPVEFSELTNMVVEKIPLDKEESRTVLMGYGKPENFIINEGFALPHGIVQGEKSFSWL